MLAADARHGHAAGQIAHPHLLQSSTLIFVEPKVLEEQVDN